MTHSQDMGEGKKEKKKRKVIDYCFNFHVAALLEDSIANDHIKLHLITVYLIMYCSEVKVTSCYFPRSHGNRKPMTELKTAYIRMQTQTSVYN